jgi:hypothetical protein
MEHVLERREQLQDQPELLAQMFDRMALTCARMSHLRAHDVALPYTLAKLQVLDGNYPPTRKMYDDLAELKDDVEHAEEACRVAYSTLVRTPHANRCLLPLARLRSFTEDRLYHISRATMLSKTVAGGMGPRLYKKARRRRAARAARAADPRAARRRPSSRRSGCSSWTRRSAHSTGRASRCSATARRLSR